MVPVDFIINYAGGYGEIRCGKHLGKYVVTYLDMDVSGPEPTKYKKFAQFKYDTFQEAWDKISETLYEGERPKARTAEEIAAFVQKQHKNFVSLIQSCLTDSEIPAEYHGLIKNICFFASAIAKQQQEEKAAFVVVPSTS